ncbi:YjcQ family protein [Bacillus sp. NPDC077027]|uniref:YjcQ family protein n=1 Tax=Bacillus sp. NPDC077027 TaxID=3390548 RepID=UPI003D06061F
MDRRKLVYSILKELQEGNEPKQTDYEITYEQWGEIAELIRDEGYAKGVSILYADDSVYFVSLSSAKITMKGIEYLEANSAMARMYKGLKEAREWIKL